MFRASDGWGTGQKDTNLDRRTVQTMVYLWDKDMRAEKENVAFHVKITDTNEPPIIPSVFTSIEEESANGTVVANLASWDQDPHGALTYQILGGNTGKAFRLDPDGMLRVQTQAALDFEQQQVYALEVKVTDGLGSYAIGKITVRVTNKNDLPFVIFIFGSLFLGRRYASQSRVSLFLHVSLNARFISTLGLYKGISGAQMDPLGSPGRLV